MNEKIKAKWLEALRSGKYKQGKNKLKGVLKDVNYYCCLGVLCEVYGLKSRLLDMGVIAGRGSYTYDYNSYRGQSMPPAQFLEAVGLEISNAEKLAGFNDSGMSFEKIADWIEEKT